eukprot:458244-Rhodomonas_salina.1
MSRRSSIHFVWYWRAIVQYALVVLRRGYGATRQAQGGGVGGVGEQLAGVQGAEVGYGTMFLVLRLQYAMHGVCGVLRPYAGWGMVLCVRGVLREGMGLQGEWLQERIRHELAQGEPIVLCYATMRSELVKAPIFLCYPTMLSSYAV